MSVYHEFSIAVDSEDRPSTEQEIMFVTRSGDGGLKLNHMTDEIRNRKEWLEIKAALTTAGAQLGWY